MKNIQIIDGAVNCVYDIFAASEEEFSVLFPDGQDIAFIDEIASRVDSEKLEEIFSKIWTRRLRKKEIQGIQGTLFYEMENKKVYYPTRCDDEAVNPEGSFIRSC
jgi:hypothetical protein